MSSTVTNKVTILIIIIQLLTTMIFMKVQWMTEDNFMACSCIVAKWISSKSSPAPAQTNSHWWYFVPLWFLRWHTKAPSYSWLKLTGAPWMALVALQWWQTHAKYRQFQPIWTQSQHWTPICTLIRVTDSHVTITDFLQKVHVAVWASLQRTKKLWALKERSEGGGEAADYTEGETSILTSCMWHLDLMLHYW